MTKNCKNCAWFCHADGKCYGTKARLFSVVPAMDPAITSGACESWSFDGLEDWERDYEDALVIMECVK